MTKPLSPPLALPPGGRDALLRNDLPSFVRASFAEISPGVELVWNEYLDLICSRLHAVAKGEIRRLIITMPPRHLKSVCVSVALPAFYLGHNPSAEVMAVSYGQELAKTFADDTRTVMTSDFYKRIFPTRLASGRQALHTLKTTARGIRRATSMEGAATGVGADLLIFDDPQKANGALSAAVRGSSNESYRGTFIGRSNNPAKSRTIIVMQRLHEDDFAGFVQTLGTKWDVLNLPAIAEQDEAYPYTTYLGRHMYRRAEGAALHPARLPLEELKTIRTDVGEAIWATQYMQRPAPAGGLFVNTEWFKRYTEADLPKPFERIVQSWDTAQTIGQWSDFSVCTTWGIKDKRSYLLHVYRKRVEYPELKRAVIEQAETHGATEIIVEDHTTGKSLIQDLRNDGFYRIEGRRPVGDKQMRMTQQAGRIQNGLVYVPQEAHWLADYLYELAIFPNGKHDDQVDSTSQALEALGNPLMKSWGFYELARQRNAAYALAQGVVEPEERYYAPGCVEWTEQQKVIAAAAAREAKAAALAQADADEAERRASETPAITPVEAPAKSIYQPGSMEWAIEQSALLAAEAAEDEARM
jgi:predicted phage terminase large subunit-like protein